MHILDLKMLRDLSRMKAQVAAIAVVVATGVSLFIAMTVTFRSLQKSEDAFYTQQRFAHVWAGLARAPMSLKQDIAELPDVSAVEARLTSQAVLDMPGIVEPASALMISIPEDPGHTVNDVYVRTGRHIAPARSNEVLVNEVFAEKNRLQPGDSLIAIVAGKKLELQIVGIALSPEYVMPIEPGAFIADERRFAIVWIGRDTLEAALDMRGVFNDVVLRLSPGADEGATIEQLDALLEPYGGRGAYGRRSQGSHVMVESHIQGLEALTLMIPMIFFLVAGFLVNIVFSRYVATQRAQIGMLKAFGYSDAQVAIHYLKLSMLVVLVGVAVAIPIGVWMARGLSEYFARFFRFPVLDFALEPSIFVIAIAVALVTAGLGVMGTIRRVASIPPIVAMTPEVPAFRRTLLDRAGITPLLSNTSKMVLRNLTKRPLRSGLASAGMALAIAVVVLGSASGEGFDRMRDVQYQAIQREDVSITFDSPRSLGTIHELRALPGISRAEAYRVVPVRVLAPGRHEDVTLFGLQDGSVLRHVVDNHFTRIRELGPGVVLTKWTAETLGYAPGDVIPVELRERERRVVHVKLADVVDDPLGENAYMDLAALGRLLGEPDTFTGANLKLDPLSKADFYEVAKDLPNIVNISYRKSSLKSYAEMSDDAVQLVLYIELLFAIIIAFGVVYNTARIMLAERGTELATLRVLGFKRREVSAILFGEIIILALPAIPIGFVVGRALTAMVIEAMTARTGGNLFHVPLLVTNSTYAFALVVFLVAAVGSAILVRRRIDRLDLVEVLKARE